MANYVTISCLGPKPLVIERHVPPEEAIERMIAHWREQLERVLPDRPGLIVLPEACDRPDKMHYPAEERLAYYLARGTRIRDFFAEVAREHRCYIAYAAHMQAEDGTWRNTVQLLGREGQLVGAYHKNYLVPAEHTVGGIIYGKQPAVFECDFGRLGAAICFDLNFDELRRQYAEEKLDVIVFPSMYHGGLMQGYWAYSCRSYFAGAVAGVTSTIVTPLGEVAAQSTNYYSYVTATVNLDRKVLHIDGNNRHFGDIKRKYGPKVRIHDPGLLGVVLLTSETDEVTTDDIVREFDLELVDEYFCRSSEARLVPGRMED